ncbi:SDR family oxidoreductase [Bradyrhizobium sp. BRP22]|uniref:dTDP-4-dehydrorhamnose reductase family protein n=1 Tax=Bradyrhizobium sp. BRP22 TaxID=2793821 RepID=UPI001CD2F7C2|nr:SDR family oxidoreductase [Bradyrhizobium sp. BRP22]MCA1452084.1 SDR family oxidoreductase [Bradyrhizobium sp. BRP22]
MRRTKVLILGASGMLGAAVFRSFVEDENCELLATIRDKQASRFFAPQQVARLVTLDVLDDNSLVSILDRERPDVVVNCVGLVKQLSSACDPLIALPINALFPHRLVRLCSLVGARVIHISTDCVFSGAKGNYTEEDPTDAQDLYGQSKLLGELSSYKNAVTLRTSIIGRELSTSHSLVEWFFLQKRTAVGYTKAIFSGLPTCELAAIIRDVVMPRPELSGVYHVSAQPISKFNLLRLIAKEYRKEISILEDSSVQIDRSLISKKFTAVTGYRAPAWPELIRRMYEADVRHEAAHV